MSPGERVSRRWLPWTRARWQARLAAAITAYLDISAEEAPAVFARYRAQLFHSDASARLRQMAAEARMDGAIDDADGYDDLAARLEHLRALGAGRRSLAWPIAVLLVRIEMGDVPDDPQQQVTLLEHGLKRASRRRAPLAWAALQLELGRAWTQMHASAAPEDAQAALTCALACFDAARPVFARAGLVADEAAALHSKGDALADLATHQSGIERVTSLEAAAQYLDDALAKRSATQTPRAWASAQSDKGTVLVELAAMAQGAARGALLARALTCFDTARAALRDAEAAPGQWAALQINTGNALQELADLQTSGEKVARLRDAVACYESAADLYFRLGVTMDWALAQNNLGNTLTKLAELDIGERRLVGLRGALTCYDAALRERRRELAPLDWASTQVNRANAQIDLAWSVPDVQRASILRKAIEGYDAALTERRRERVPLDWAMTQNNKGIALSDLAERLEGDERANALREAVGCFDAALTERRHLVVPADWAASTGARGAALAKLASLSSDTERVTVLREAARCFEGALSESTQAVAPVEWAMLQNNLALTLMDQAVTLSGEERAQAFARARACYDGSLSVFTRTATPADHRRIAQRAGIALFQHGQWAAAASYLAMALDALDDLYTLSVTQHGRETELLAGGDLAAHLAYALVRADTPGAARHAVEALERGRARVTGEAIARQQAQLAVTGQVAPMLLEAFQTASDRLASVAFAEGAAEQRAVAGAGAESTRLELAQAARSAYDEVVAHIREQAPDFLRSTDAVVDAQAALAADERLAYIATTSAGAVSVLIGPINSVASANAVATPRDTSTLGWYDEILTTMRVEALLRGEPSQSGSDAAPAGLLPAQNGKGDLTLALQQVSQALGQPGTVLTQLANACAHLSARRLAIVSCGLLGLLPLHAAETPLSDSSAPSAGPHYLVDVVRVVYTPSARIWQNSRTHRQRTESPNALVIGNPLPQPPGYVPLAGAEEEARRVYALLAAYGAAALLQTTEATHAAVTKILHAKREELTHLHFACHGIADLDVPDRSGLVLAHGERLAVSELLNPTNTLRFNQVRLVALSACQTGLPGLRLPDEAIGLPASWLQAGAASVIASQWPVSDAATLALMAKFYEIHLLDQVEPVDALWLAQRWLRGDPHWRADCAAAGAQAAARGMEASAAIDAMETHLLLTPEQQAQAVGRASVEEQATGHKRQQRSTASQTGLRHWAAFAAYGS